MEDRLSSVAARPSRWQPLVTPGQWRILAHSFRDAPEVLNDLQVVLGEISPGTRRALLENLMATLQSEDRPIVALWTALGLTGQDAKMRSAAALGRLHALGDDAPDGTVTQLPPKPPSGG